MKSMKIQMVVMLLSLFVITSGEKLAFADVPDFNKSESEFIAPDVKILASEFASEDYGNKYVVFEAKYGGHGLGWASNRGAYSDVNWMFLTEDSLGKNLKVGWHEIDKKVSRPLIGVKNGDKLKIFAYVVPENNRVKLSNNKNYFSMNETLIYVMKIVPVTK